MSDIPSLPRRIQTQETDFRSPVSESTAQKIGGSINFILDYYVIYPGFIMPFAGIEANLPPLSAWIPCDGREVSRVTYSSLFSYISTTWGSGNSSTTFNVPDLRGLFLRMVDRTLLMGPAGRDPDEASRVPIGTETAVEPGSYEADQLISHNHLVPLQSGTGFVQQCVNPSFVDNSNFVPRTSETGGLETRPKNAYVIYLIKT